MKILKETKDNRRTENGTMEITKLVMETTVYNHVSKQKVTIYLNIIIGMGYPIYEVFIATRSEDGGRDEYQDRFSSLNDARTAFVSAVSQCQNDYLEQVFGKNN